MVEMDTEGSYNYFRRIFSPPDVASSFSVLPRPTEKDGKGRKRTKMDGKGRERTENGRKRTKKDEIFFPTVNLFFSENDFKVLFKSSSDGKRRKGTKKDEATSGGGAIFTVLGVRSVFIRAKKG